MKFNFLILIFALVNTNDLFSLKFEIWDNKGKFLGDLECNVYDKQNDILDKIKYKIGKTYKSVLFGIKHEDISFGINIKYCKFDENTIGNLLNKFKIDESRVHILMT